MTRNEFAGQVNGDQIKGAVKVAMPNGTNIELPWVARRTTTTAYFRPTGVDTK